MTLNDRLTVMARVGFAARGVVYILIGWFALQAALYGGEMSDNQGALGTMAAAPFGRALLAACAVGFAGYAIWRLTEAVFDPEGRGDDAKGRFEQAGYAVSGCAHVFLAYAAARIATGNAAAREGSPGDASARGWSSWLLDQPGGVALLTLVGVAFFAVAAAQAIKAYKASFEDLRRDVPAPRYVRWLGRAGYAARALIFAVIGWLIVSAAWAHDASKAGGVGEALESLRSQPQGMVLLAAVGCGLALFGVFSLVEARYRTLRVKAPTGKLSGLLH